MLGRDTRGTETSKYPEEKKEKSILKVAASEMGRAQTESYGFRGCGQSIRDGGSLVEEIWKGPPKRVTVPYTKGEDPQTDPEYYGARETL